MKSSRDRVKLWRSSWPDSKLVVSWRDLFEQPRTLCLYENDSDPSS